MKRSDELRQVLSVKPLDDYCLELKFDNGVKGIYHVNPKKKGGVFLKLLDKKIFKKVKINPDWGSIEWPDSIDLCPEAIYLELKKLKHS